MAQLQAAFIANYYSDTNCQNFLGLTPISAPAPPRQQLLPANFGSIIVKQTSTNIQTIFLCEFGCECFADECNTVGVPSGWIGTNTCVSTTSEVDGNGKPIFPNT
jgi:hypothetical protein